MSLALALGRFHHEQRERAGHVQAEPTGAPEIAGSADALVSAPGIPELHWSEANWKFCALFAGDGRNLSEHRSGGIIAPCHERSGSGQTGQDEEE